MNRKSIISYLLSVMVIFSMVILFGHHSSNNSKLELMRELRFQADQLAKEVHVTAVESEFDSSLKMIPSLIPAVNKMNMINFSKSEYLKHISPLISLIIKLKYLARADQNKLTKVKTSLNQCVKTSNNCKIARAICLEHLRQLEGIEGFPSGFIDDHDTYPREILQILHNSFRL